MTFFRPLLATLLLFQIVLNYAQTPISGIINHYAAVEELDACRARVIVDDVGEIQVNDTLLLIQMQGAEINLSNSDEFGEVQAYNNAGLFEGVVVDAIFGDTLQLTHRWINAYDLSGQVQLVRMPNYDEAIVDGTLRAQDWNGRTGGILAFSAGRLVLQADINVSGLGFRGGSAALDYNGTCTWLINHDNYRYLDFSIRSGLKGEGIAGIPELWPRGRGASANGGGAGNDHNTGGGGGAQVTKGGRGGRNDNPNPLGCQGRNPGEAGRAIALTDNRIFLGGGGGSGHGNNNVATDGGHGGGMVLIFAQQMEGNGFAVRANGQDAANSQDDGAGAGGAGGTVLLDVDRYLDDFTVEAIGGRGGDADNSDNPQCYGPGGGGSGGRVLANVPGTIDLSVAGGDHGITFNSSECADGPNGATPGEDGISGAPLALNFSSEQVFEQLIADFNFTIDGLTVNFDNLGSAPRFEWSFGDGSSSSLINPEHSFSQPGTYSVTLLAIDSVCGDTASLTRNIIIELLPEADANFSPGEGCPPLSVDFLNNSRNADSVIWFFEGGSPNRSTLDNPSVLYNQPGTYSVELRAFNNAAADTLFFQDTIEVFEAPDANFLFDVDGLELTTQNFSTGDNYNWSFGDGNGSSEFQPVYNYERPGSYELVLIVSNDCGSDTARFNIQIGDPPVADFTIESLSGVCAPVFLELRNASTGAFDSLRWELPGATPSSSNEASPGVVYNQAGSYDIRLILFYPFGTAESFEEDAFTVTEPPVADFEYELNGATVRFSNLSQNADDFRWNFGDGTNSTALNPEHTYSQPGFYQVVLSVENGDCVDSLTEDILIDASSGTDSFSVFIPDAFSPNDDGINDYFTIYSTELQLIESLQIFDRWGNRLFLGESIPPGEENAGWNGRANGKLLDPGVYVFLTEIRFLNGETKQVQGSVTLMK